MTQTNELTRTDIVVDPDIEVECDPTPHIVAYLETWFDVDRKFGLHTNSAEDTWLNLYAIYDPFDGSLLIRCVVSSDTDSFEFRYTPTASEERMITDLITEQIRKSFKQTPKEFCVEFQDCFTEADDVW